MKKIVISILIIFIVTSCKVFENAGSTSKNYDNDISSIKSDIVTLKKTMSAMDKKIDSINIDLSNIKTKVYSNQLEFNSSLSAIAHKTEKIENDQDSLIYKFQDYKMFDNTRDVAIYQYLARNDTILDRNINAVIRHINNLDSINTNRFDTTFFLINNLIYSVQALKLDTLIILKEQIFDNYFIPGYEIDSTFQEFLNKIIQ